MVVVSGPRKMQIMFKHQNGHFQIIKVGRLWTKLMQNNHCIHFLLDDQLTEVWVMNKLPPLHVLLMWLDSSLVDMHLKKKKKKKHEEQKLI